MTRVTSRLGVHLDELVDALRIVPFHAVHMLWKFLAFGSLIPFMNNGFATNLFGMGVEITPLCF